MMVLGAINYIDRSSLSIAVPYISQDYNITDARVIGLLQSAFFWAYALMQLPCGVLADRFSPRTLIGTATVVWGAFQGLGALCGNYVTFALTRVGLGVSEAPIMPAGAKLMGVWLTPNERGRGSMLLDGGAALGTSVGAVIITGLIGFFGSWRAAFLIAGLGTVLAGVFAFYFIRSRPSEHRGVNALERAYIEATNHSAAVKSESRLSFATVRPYLRQRNVLALIGGWCCYSTVFYGLMVWAPSYLQATHGFNLKEMGSAVALMFFLCFVGQQLGGLIADRWRKAGGRPNVIYHTMFSISAIVSGASVFAVTRVSDPVMVIVLLSTALFPLRWASMYWSIPGLLGAQSVAGTICGTMNFCSNLTAAIVPIIVGFIVEATGSYFFAMMFFGAAAVGYLFCSLSINFDRPMSLAENRDRAGAGLSAAVEG
ncbi:MFS transporter [Telmatospirillum siberiense]|uniref:MFS transporter n=1 Tax=Telmatospirillum siberiense TaxID=382514 RepID=A0A2N3PM34_9PROT|nr:MFS transporter [Telmatospirillum siberiense]PKU21469.1 MFS transporter [Telmatospirillum siberiense]